MMRKQRVINILHDEADYCTHKQREMFSKLEYDKNMSEEEKNKAYGAYKAYLDIEGELLHKIDKLRWNCD